MAFKIGDTVLEDLGYPAMTVLDIDGPLAKFKIHAVCPYTGRDTSSDTVLRVTNIKYVWNKVLNGWVEINYL